MDNVTHTLAGMLLAELALQLRARFAPRDTPSPRGLRAAAYVASVFGNNVPDFDFVYTALTGGKLGYLLHHRGHTHTLLLGVPLGLLGALPFAWFARRRQLAVRRHDWLLVIALCLIGPLCHVGMDYSNNYGVHPFWPVDTRWFYGDLVFIIEPWFWMTSIPALALAAERRVTRWVLVLLLASLLALGIALKAVPSPILVAMVAWALAMTVLYRNTSPLVRAASSIVLCLEVFTVLVASSTRARQQLALELAHQFPAAKTHDIVVTPAPGNPLCFNALAVQTSGDDYYVRRAVLALRPEWYSAGECPRSLDGVPTAPLTAVPGRASGRLEWRGQFVAPLAELRALERGDCAAAAFLRWSRVPFWTEAPRRVLGDLRYDREAELGFAEIELERSPVCPKAVPSWQPPRSDVLSP